MKHIAAAVLLFAVTTPCMAQTPPEWAYPVNPPGFKPRADDGTPRRVEGSNATYTLTQLRDRLISLAKAATDADIQAAAAYFSAMRPRAVIRVVESESAPRTYVTGWHLARIDRGELEATGQRIIEVPEVLEQFENRDTHARFIAYVPPGSVKKGETLAATGGGKTVACAGCHGRAPSGTADVPGIAGRSPTYLFRQLYEFKHGGRAGVQSALMKPTVENLALDDMIALAAYAGSLPPAPRED